MKLSIVTISFNQARFLRQCINSVLSQDHNDIEYIIVDPGSTDGSREIIQSYGTKVISIFEPDNGPSDGLNKGFALATGEIMYFINSDDYVLPGAFSKVIQCFEANPDSDVILAAGLLVDELGNTERTFYPSKVSPKAYVNGAVTLFQQGMFFRSDLFRSVGGFNIENKSCWDGELLLSFLLRNVRVVRLMEKVAVFRIYPTSITGSQRFATIFQTDSQRMFEVVYGNGKKSNRSSAIYFRLRKLLCDPIYLYKRIVEGRN